MSAPPLTPTERAELAARPVTRAWRDYDDAALALRVDIARGPHAVMLADPATPEWTRTLYATYPPWAFYTDTDNGSMCRRIFGFMQIEGETCARAHCITAHLGWINKVVGGVPVTELRAIERWSDEHKAKLRLNNAPGVFLDPLGFTFCLQQ